MHRKRVLLSFGLAGLSLLQMACATHPATGNPKKATLLTGQPGQYYEAVGEAIRSVAGKHGVEITVLNSTGSKGNIGKLADDTCDFAIIQSDAAHRVWYREPPFNGLPPRFELELVAPLFTEKVQILTRPHLYVSTPAELKGRHLWLGGRGSGSSLSGISVLEASGFMPQEAEKIGLETQDFEEEADRLKENRFQRAIALLRSGKLDAVFQTSVSPTDRILQALESSEVRLVGLDWKQVETLVANGTYLANSLQKTEYPRLEHGVYTVGVQALLVARNGADPDVVKALARTLVENQADVEAELRVILSKNHSHNGKADPGVLNLLGSRPTNQLLEHAPRVKEILPKSPLPRRSLFQLTLLGMGLVIICVLYSFVLREEHKNKIRKATEGYLTFLLVLLGTLTIWLIGSVLLHAVEGNVNEHFASLTDSAVSLGRSVFAKLYFGEAPTLTTSQGRFLTGMFAWIMALPLVRGLFPSVRKHLLGITDGTAKGPEASGDAAGDHAGQGQP